MHWYKVICILGVSFGTLVNGKGKHEKESDHDRNDNEEDHKPHWSYRGEYYPPNWGKMVELCNPTSSRQSPINIEPFKTTFEDDLSRIELMEHHNRYRKFTIANNGHSVNIQIDHKVMIHGGNLPSKGYKLAGIHFHWGSSDFQGSEHTVNEERFPLEMHMVTYDTESHSELGDAVFGDNSLAVLSTMFKISDDDNPDMQILVDGLRQVYEPGSKGKIRSFPVSRLLPHHTDKYFRYMGSLTTPPCAQSVIWTLFLHTQSISSKQMEEFREIVESKDENGDDVYMEDNWRPVQLLHGRIVYRSFLFKSEMSTAIVNYGAGAEAIQEGASGATMPLISALTVFILVLTHLL